MTYQIELTRGRRFSTVKMSSVSRVSVPEVKINNTIESIVDSYLKLITEVITYLELQDSESNLLLVPVNTENLKDVSDIDFMPIEIKHFCSDIRVSSKSAFGRNLLEILLFPISKNVIVSGKDVYLNEKNKQNYELFKNLLLNNKVREAFLEYIHRIPEIQKGVITTRTSLKSYRKEPVVSKLVTDMKEYNSDILYRYTYLGLFLESLYFEIVENSQGKRSKAQIFNYLVDLLSKSITAPNK